MSVPKDTTYPKAATQAAWDKGKSLADKASSKTKHTGLGPALKAAQEAWAKIPLAVLVPAPAKLKSVDDVKEAQKKAEAAIDNEVDKAFEAVRKARDLADTVSKNKLLSKDSAKAAAAAYSALASLAFHRGEFNTVDFDQLLETRQAEANRAYALALGQLTDLEFKSGKDVVATASAGVWNKKELKTSGTVWKPGKKAKDYIGKKLTVEGRQGADDHNVERISGQTNSPKARFINDLKLESASGSAAVLKP
jgi:hypothetical protein